MVTWQHVGTYTCVATNVVGSETKSAKLSVQGAECLFAYTCTSTLILNIVETVLETNSAMP